MFAELAGLAQPLFILGIFYGLPVLVAIIIVGIIKTLITGGKLTKDLLTNDEEE